MSNTEKKPIILGRNDPCRCGSGKKYKVCCLSSDEDAAVMQRKILSAHQFAGQLRIVPDASAIPLFPWMKPDFRGIGKYQPKED